MKLKEAVHLLEKITKLKVVLKETVSIESLAQSKQPKKTRDSLQALLSFKTMEVIPEREWSKAIGGLPTFPLPSLPYEYPGLNKIPYEVMKVRFELGLFGGNFRFTYTGNVVHLERNIATGQKLLAAWEGKVPSGLVDIIKQILKGYNGLIPMAKELDELRAKVKSGKEIKQQAQRDEIKGRTNPQIQTAVDEIAEDFRKKIEANWLTSFNRYVERYKVKAKETGLINPYEMYPKREDMELRSNILDILNFDRTVNQYSLKTEQQIKQLAHLKSIEDIKPFAYKMADKLGGLLPKTAGVTFTVSKVKQHDSTHSNLLKFSINNNESSFLVQNQIVGAWSKYQRPFYRFPTTFHDLIVKGKRVKSPDEITVKQALNAAYG